MSDHLLITISREEVAEAVRGALLKPARYSHDEAPLAAMARSVVTANAKRIETMLGEQVAVVPADKDLAAALRRALAEALTEAVKAKAKSVVASIGQTAILKLLGDQEAPRG